MAIQKELRHEPFLWIFREIPSNEVKVGYYDEKSDLNKMDVGNKSLPVVLAQPFLIKTHTKTMVEKERDDTD